MCISYHLRQSHECFGASRILISIRGTEAARKRGRTAAAQDYRISGALDAAGSPCPPSFISRTQRTVFDSDAVTLRPGACARVSCLGHHGRRRAPPPAPHLRDKNLIKGASAGILEPRNSRRTARGPEEHHC